MVGVDEGFLTLSNVTVQKKRSLFPSRHEWYTINLDQISTFHQDQKQVETDERVEKMRTAWDILDRSGPKSKD